MYTAKEIREIAFTKSFGGYKTIEVDDFVDRCADTVETLTNENAELNKKLEILANKLLEYRNEEDTIRTTLMSAQRLGDTVLREAKHKAELILEDAAIKSEKAISELKAEEDAERANLAKLKQDVADFKARILDMYREHLTQVSLLPEEEPEAEAPAEPEPEAAEATEPAETEEETPAAEAVPVGESVIDEPATLPVEDIAADIPADIPDEESSTDEEAPASKFANLQFGDDYVVEDDEPHKGPFGRRK